MRGALLAMVVLGCASTSSRKSDAPAIVPGEFVVRIAEPNLLSAEALSKALGEEVAVDARECLGDEVATCRLVLRRIRGRADEEWTTWAARRLEVHKPAGILSVELNSLANPR